MRPPDRTVEQDVRGRLHAVALAGREGRAPGAPDRRATRPPVDGSPAALGARSAAAEPAPSPAPASRRARHRTGSAATAAPAADAVAAQPSPAPPEPHWLPVRPGTRTTRDAGGGNGSGAVGLPVEGGALEDRPVAEPPGARLPGADAPDPDGVGADVHDVAVRARAEALAAAAQSYTRVHGHPLDHPSEDAPTTTRRWWLSTRHAVVAGVAVVVLTVGVVVRASADLPEAPVALATSPAEQGPSAGDGGAAAAPASGAPGVGDAPGSGSGGGATGAPTVAPVEVTGTGADGSDRSAPDGARAPSGADAGFAAGTGAPGVVVHVVGQVPAPGVLTLPAGSRVGDAVAAAGGPGAAADLSAVNLARVVVDGEQIHVPAHGEAARIVPPAAAAGGGAGASPAGGPPAVAGTAGAPVALNTADLAALDALPGIGPVLAQRILDWRAANGPFRSVEELGEVSGIGEALLTRLRPLVRV